MELSTVTPRLLEELERELISFVYEDSWHQKWRGENVPKDVFRSFAAHARRISDSFTAGRRDIDLHYLRSKEERSAYLLYFHMASVVRMLAVFEECRRRGLWHTGAIRVLDLGSGPGPALWAVRLAQQKFGGTISEAVALDGEKAILPVAKNLWDRLSQKLATSPVNLRLVRADFRDHRTKSSLQRLGRFDLVLCANALNELGFTIGAQKRMEIFKQVLSENVTENGLFIFLEPALQKTSKELTAFRDELISKTDVAPPIPCGHGGTCPLNAEPRDWCNFEVSWAPPPIRRRIEKALEHQTGMLRYSYLALRNGKMAPAPDVYRVISDALEIRGGNLLLLCAPGRKLAIRFDRKTGRFAEVLKSGRRGDLMEVRFSGEAKAAGAGYAAEIDATALTSVNKI